MNRYSRQISLKEIAQTGQQKLKNARVLVIGAGGLGCPVLQNLAAAGVGTLGIVDGDLVSESNLNRQFLYTMEDCGKLKVEVAQKVLKSQNPDINIKVFPYFFSKENAFQIVNNFDIIADCTDTIFDRYLINDVSLRLKIPMVYASIHLFQGQVSVFNYKNGPSYRCLFPEKPGLKNSISCDEAGVLGAVSNTIGSLQATEILKIILEIETVLSGKLLLYDALTATMQNIHFERNAQEIEKGIVNAVAILNNQNHQETINATRFLEKCKSPNVVIVDVRASHEVLNFETIHLVKIDLDELEKATKDWNKNQEIVLFCKTGFRSQKALELLKNKGFTAVFQLQKGIQSI